MWLLNRMQTTLINLATDIISKFFGASNFNRDHIFIIINSYLYLGHSSLFQSAKMMNFIHLKQSTNNNNDSVRNFTILLMIIHHTKQNSTF
jgi:hypothetical protein